MLVVKVKRSHFIGKLIVSSRAMLKLHPVIQVSTPPRNSLSTVVDESHSNILHTVYEHCK